MTPDLSAAASADHLTAVLRRAGVLGEGCVREVAVTSARDTIVSHIIRLAPEYEGASAEAPRSLILKVAQANFAASLWRAGQQEVAFYTGVAPLMAADLTPRCFDGHFDTESHVWHLLLEDLTDSHQIATPWPLPPTLPQAQSIVRALARFHAAWWDEPRLGVSVGQWLGPEFLTDIDRQFAAHFARFRDLLGDRLPAERRALYERLIDATPRLRQRYYSHRNVTLTHGDAHIWNFLLPQDTARDDVRLFDFDQWRTGIGAGDLSYMMGLQWYPELRQRFERSLLDFYHDTLLAHGVAGYDRAALQDDYRRAVLWQITKPVWQWSIGIPPVIWWNNLERILLAVDDLGSAELLD